IHNSLSIDWLKWLGFTFDEPAPYGKDGSLFYHFYAKIPSVGNLNQGGMKDVCCSSGRGGQCIGRGRNGSEYGGHKSTGEGFSGGL
ncbi:hypothetical protein NL523_27970, partial [Klebsiella pneumoniae]|nr:hypothetical protein [Klebsiella pneumoniae]MCP6663587.1 hypothetical protein [Klebsiella pneumoniae]